MTDDSPRSSLLNASHPNSSCEATFEISKKPRTKHIIEILVREPKWKGDPSFYHPDFIQDCLCSVLKMVPKRQGPFELSILLTNDAESQALNKAYRQKDSATNILSFESGHPLDSQASGHSPEHIPLGDLVLAYETVEREAQSQNKSFHDHLTHLLIHGLLHLFGFDHENDREADEMERLEIDILNKDFHIKNPYIQRG